MRFAPFAAVGIGLLAAAISSSSCTVKQPDPQTYFDRVVEPVLTTSCVRTNTGAGCHVADDKGNAFGNLDVSTFEGVNRRRDLLADYGPYGQPAMLVKNIPPFTVNVQTFDGDQTTITTDIKHTGGPILDPTATGYQTLRRWIDNGATANNSGITPSNLARLPCSATLGNDPAFDSTKDPTSPDFSSFASSVIPVFKKTCAASNCHGTPANELYLTCGDTPEQIRWNYFASVQYLAQTAEQSELVRRPLSPAQGGSFHEGGPIFQSVNDPDYKSLLDWAQAHGPLVLQNPDPNFIFFTHRVQPILVKKGCMMLQCHSAAMFHDFRLRGGTGGSFSLTASKRNYTLSLAQLSLESEDINASRIVRKNLYRPEQRLNGIGIVHRGGALFEDFGDANASGAACDAIMPPVNYDTDPIDKIPAYCVMREWHKRERAARNLAPLSGIVYVSRAIPAGADRAQDFETYSPSSDLMLVGATMSPMGQVMVAGAPKSLAAGCGLSPATADIKRPAVSWDGKKIAFAARSSASEPLQIYEMASDGTGCQKHADINAIGPMAGGNLIHNFDPQYSPPDASGAMHLVFSSTRGNAADNPNFDYNGPQRTPADPSKLNANLYVYEPDPAAAGKNRIRQLTFQLNLERYTSFMSDGRAIFDTEKRAPGFYQLALRRINVDGGDYHPLYGQRSSIGFREVTQVAELADRNFAAIFAQQGWPHQGGVLAMFNRSIGIDFDSPDPKDYLIDASVIDPNAPASPEPAFFLHSLRFTNGGKPGTSSDGTYTSPAILPNDQILVSFGMGDPSTFGGDYDLYQLDPATGTKTKLLGSAGTAEIQAVGVFERANKGLYQSAFDEPNGHTVVYPDQPNSEITVLDMPVLASLVFQNTPTGRPVEDFSSFDVYEDLPPTPDVTSFAQGGTFVTKDDFGQLYVRRRLIGPVSLQSDKSTKFTLPGGVPIVLHLPETTQSKALGGLPRYQKEAMTFYPGEYVHQSFRHDFFNGLCAQCHGAVSGKQVDVAVQPDLLTQASTVLARDSVPQNLALPPAMRGNPEPAPATP